MLRKPVIARLNSGQLLPCLVACLSGILYAVFASSVAAADQSSNITSHEIYIPDIYYLRNPLKNKDDGNKVIRFDSSYGLDNDDLLRAVSDMQDMSMPTSHRLLNYQWLNTNDGKRHSHEGGRAISEIFLTGLKTFWDNRYGDKLYKGKIMHDKNSSFYSDMDYRIRLSDDSLKMSVEYTF